MDDRFQHVIRAQQYFVVPEAQDSEPGTLEHAGATGVIGLLVAMLATVELHDQLVLDAAEVRVVTGDRVLAPELHAQLGGTQARPEFCFGVGLVPS